MQLVSVMFFLHTLGAPEQPAKLPTLTIYTYDSLLAPEGLGKKIFPLFERSHACVIHPVSLGDAAQTLNQIEMELKEGKPRAQIFLGLDQNLWDRAMKSSESWHHWRPDSWNKISSTLRVSEGFLPFDYGVLALMADMVALRKLKLKPPVSLRQLLEPAYHQSLLLEDPRTSSPGLGFLLYSHDLLKSGYENFWKKLRTQWLTLSPGWDEAYGLFYKKKEAPMVWSYTTSQAYHEAHGDTAERYRAVEWSEGHPIQIEGALLVKGSFKDAREEMLAHDFLNFLLSDEVQSLIPESNWMLPVRNADPLPSSFKNIPKPTKLYNIFHSAEEIRRLLDQWNELVSKGSKY